MKSIHPEESELVKECKIDILDESKIITNSTTTIKNKKKAINYCILGSIIFCVSIYIILEITLNYVN